VSEKSDIFHVGSKIDYEKKVLFYQDKRNAYLELPFDPLMETFNEVVRLLNDLNRKKQMRVWRYNKLMPNKEKIKLAYLYFISKSHKVIDI
jgi:hypothetical protein